MTSTCAHCGKPLGAKPTGRPGRFCDDRCRASARRALAAKEARLERLPTPATETPQRPSYGRGLGEGDLCPQDPAHGAMYLFGSPKSKQWCPHSGHRGNAWYAFDGVTPINRNGTPIPALEPAPGFAEGQTSSSGGGSRLELRANPTPA